MTAGRIWRGVAVCMTLMCTAYGASKPSIYLGVSSSDVERQAATELQRFLYEAGSVLLPIKNVDAVEDATSGFVLGTPQTLPALPESWPFGLEVPQHDGYVLCTLKQKPPLLVIAALNSRGVQNGVFGFLEKAGFGFYLSGDTLPSAKSIAALLNSLPDWRESHSPIFAVRGALPWLDRFCGAATWSAADYRHWVDQLVRMRYNLVVFYVSEQDPFAANDSSLGFPKELYTQKLTDGKKNGSTARGVLSAARDLFDRRNELYRNTQEDLRQPLAYAKSRGMSIGIGLKVTGDPFEPGVQHDLETRVKALLAAYPQLDYLWLWQPEHYALQYPPDPPRDSLLRSYGDRWGSELQGVGDASRRLEAVRLVAFALQVNRLLEAFRPDVRLVVAGWGSRETAGFGSYLTFLDKLLPNDVVLTAVDSLPASPVIGDVFEKVSREREKWPVLALEYDGDLWMPQPNTYEIAGACRDAWVKGCPGVIALHWRLRDPEESAAYVSRFTWNPDLSIEDFYRRYVRDVYGESFEKDLFPVLLDLQRLGYRWVGSLGQNESGVFAWTPGEKYKVDQLNQASFRLRNLSRAPSLAQSITQMSFKAIGGKSNTTISGNMPPALADLLAYIDFVLAYDRAANDFRSGGALDELLSLERTEEARTLVQNSSLLPAFRFYASRIRNKSELGVLTSLITRTTADLRSRLSLDPEEELFGSLQDAGKKETPELHVLPDRVLITGVSLEDLRVVMRVRPVGKKLYDKIPLKPITDGVFERPTRLEMFAEGTVYEYGFEVLDGTSPVAVWPAGFPKKAAVEAAWNVKPPSAPEPASPVSVQPPVPKITVIPDRYAIQLSWKPQEGVAYTLYREAERLGTVFDGWFEDTAPPSNTTVRYTLEARHLSSGNSAVRMESVAIPELPLPEPPKNVSLTTRGPYTVLYWDSDSPIAAEYVVVRYDAKRNKEAEKRVPACLGHRLSMADLVQSNHTYAYTIAGVTPDGRVGQPSPMAGIVVSLERPKPRIDISTNEPGFLQGLAELAEQGIVIGGKGWSDLPKQQNWNRTNELTLFVTVKPEDLNGVPVLICKGPWQQPAFYLQAIEGKLRFYLAGVGTLDAGMLTVGKWQRITATFGQDEMSLFLDGRLVGRRRAASPGSGTAQVPMVGRYEQPDEAFTVRGLIDEVRLYESALTPEEIADLVAESGAPDAVPSAP